MTANPAIEVPKSQQFDLNIVQHFKRKINISINFAVKSEIGNIQCCHERVKFAVLMYTG